MDTVRVGVGALLLLTSIVACGASSDPVVTRSNVRSLAKETLSGTTGGRVESHNVKLDVPPAALTNDTAITLSAFDAATGAAIGLPDAVHPLDGTAYTVGPAGVSFAKPVDVTFNFDETIGTPSSNNASFPYDAKKIFVVYRAEPGTNAWQPASASLSQFRPLRAKIEHARDIVPALVDISCVPEPVCSPNASGAGDSCAITKNGAGVRCEQHGNAFNIECTCEGTSDVVLTTTTIPRDSANLPLFKGLAHLCGVDLTCASR